MKNLIELGSGLSPDERAPVVPALDAVTIQRPLKLFKNVLGLTPGRGGPPDPDFLVKLMTDHDGHQAWLRAVLGVHFQNFVNAVQGRHVREGTRKAMAVHIGISLSQLEEFLSAVAPSGRMAEDSPWRHLAPGLPAVLALVQGLPARFHEAVVKRKLSCPGCGGNVLHDVDAWWASNAGYLAPPEYQFVERLLTSMVYFHALERLVSAHPVIDISELANPPKHPIGNWLVRLQAAFDAEDFYELSTNVAIDQPRLKKWSSGSSDLMSLKAGRQMLEALPSTKGAALKPSLESGMETARAIAFVVDFVQAAATYEVKRTSAQETVAARLVRIRQNTALGWQNALSPLTLRAVSGALPTP